MVNRRPIIFAAVVLLLAWCAVLYLVVDGAQALQMGSL